MGPKAARQRKQEELRGQREDQTSSSWNGESPSGVLRAQLGGGITRDITSTMHPSAVPGSPERHPKGCQSQGVKDRGEREQNRAVIPSKGE